MKIGIFGGTFNPPHRGHERILNDFTERLALDRVLIIPDKRPVHKAWENLADDEKRYEMCALAFCGPKYEVSRMEIDRNTDSYTVFTLRELKEKYPDGDFYLIIGSDMFLCFDKWYRYEEIMQGCTLCVASRNDGEELDKLRSYAFSHLKIGMATLEGDGIIISPCEPLEISSTQLRDILSAGGDASKYLNENVFKYIEDRGLYGYAKK